MMFVGFVGFVCAVIYLTASAFINWKNTDNLESLAGWGVFLSIVSGAVGLVGVLYAADH